QRLPFGALIDDAVVAPLKFLDDGLFVLLRAAVDDDNFETGGDGLSQEILETGAEETLRVVSRDNDGNENVVLRSARGMFGRLRGFRDRCGFGAGGRDGDDIEWLTG